MDTREFEREMFRAAGIASHNFADAGSRSGADEGSGSGEPRQARVGDRCLGEGEEMDSQIFERGPHPKTRHLGMRTNWRTSSKFPSGVSLCRDHMHSSRM